MKMIKIVSSPLSAVLLFALLLVPGNLLLADGGIVFHLVQEEVGLTYARARSPEFATVIEFQLRSLDEPLTPDLLPLLPPETGGFPGIAVWDYDGDGDLDLYVTNGPDSPNSLFHSLLTETGALHFVDVAESVGLAATEQDSAGVCYGDLDNDGDSDLVVLGRHAANHLYVNHGSVAGGPVSFSLAAASGVEGGERWSTSCALGDVDGDGRLDLFVANLADGTHALRAFVEPFAFNEHNQLFLNTGELTFIDVSAASGVEDPAGLSAGFEGSPTATWAVTMADLDTDGDLDILFGDDQAGNPAEAAGGLDSGRLHVLLNDGSGVFSDHPLPLGAWMGFALGDLDCDGILDLYATNGGEYLDSLLPVSIPPGQFTSRWFLGHGDGTFSDPGVAGLTATPFGWGTAAFDYDNDGDLDILTHGGLDASLLVTADNPGTLHQNQGCSAEFEIDFAAIPDDPSCVDPSGQPVPNCTAHTRRNVRGVAVGDLDKNGFPDVVTVADIVLSPPLPLFPSPAVFGSVFDDSARWVPFFVPTADGFVWTGLNPAPGDLVVELSSGNDNNWVGVTVRGSIGLTSAGRVNRDGIGAVVSFTPAGGSTVKVPVTGGSSHASQHGPERIFGLGSATSGTVEIFWPGGTRNRLYDVEHGERLVFPEIPCDFVGDGEDRLGELIACVTEAVHDLAAGGVIDPSAKGRFIQSAVRAFQEQP